MSHLGHYCRNPNTKHEFLCILSNSWWPLHHLLQYIILDPLLLKLLSDTHLLSSAIREKKWRWFFSKNSTISITSTTYKQIIIKSNIFFCHRLIQTHMDPVAHTGRSWSMWTTKDGCFLTLRARRSSNQILLNTGYLWILEHTSG